MEDLPEHGSGTASVLSASSLNIAPIPADSNNVALTLNWTGSDHATENIKYTIQFDEAGENFSNPYSREVLNDLTTSFVAKELNSMLLSRGFAFNVPVNMEARVVASYVNNNEKKYSNVLAVSMTPYKVPPKVALPASGKLFIVGNATQGAWDNPVPLPSQELTRIDETTFGGIFQLNADGSYLLLPVNGDWGAKYGFDGSNNGNNAAGDIFKAEGGDMKAPSASGWYKLIFDFQAGRFTVEPWDQQHGLPTELFIVGNATPGAWDNPVPLPSQKFTRVNSTQFTLSLPMSANGEYLLLPENGNWGKKFGLDNIFPFTKLNGTFKPEGGNFPGPEVAGTYDITVDFINNSYKLVKQ
jgi:hypothetical protein